MIISDSPASQGYPQSLPNVILRFYQASSYSWLHFALLGYETILLAESDSEDFHPP